MPYRISVKTLVGTTVVEASRFQTEGAAAAAPTERAAQGRQLSSAAVSFGDEFVHTCLDMASRRHVVRRAETDVATRTRGLIAADVHAKRFVRLSFALWFSILMEAAHGNARRATKLSPSIVARESWRVNARKIAPVARRKNRERSGGESAPEPPDVVANAMRRGFVSDLGAIRSSGVPAIKSPPLVRFDVIHARTLSRDAAEPRRSTQWL